MASKEHSHLPALHRLRLRASNCYLLVWEGAVLIDAGLRGEGSSILRTMSRKGLKPGELKLILLTHGHFDHAGAASELAAATGAPVALHAQDARWLQSGQAVPAPPVTRWARIISRLMSAEFLQRGFAIAPFTPDILLGDEESSLAQYGVPARVLHTPGHTAGSISVLMGDGRSVVGDLAMNGLPALAFRPASPIVAQDMPLLVKSWQMLCEKGAATIYPGHGSPFPSHAMRLAN